MINQVKTRQYKLDPELLRGINQFQHSLTMARR